jgi:hypothetical protein
MCDEHNPENSMIKDAVVFLLMVALAVSSMLVLLNPVYKASCTAQWEKSGYETKHSFWEGCLVKVDGKYIPAENVRKQL